MAEEIVEWIREGQKMYLNTDGVIILYSLHVFQQLLRDDAFMQKKLLSF